MTLEQIRARMNEIFAAQEAHIAATAEGETDEQRAAYVKLEEEYATLAERAQPLIDRETRSKRVAESRAKWGSVTVGAPEVKGNADGVDLRLASPTELLGRARKVLDDSESTEHLTDEQRSHVEKTLRTSSGDLQGADVARRLLATEDPNYRSAFQKYASGKQYLMTGDEARAVERAMSIGTDGAGGFAVPILIDPTIIMTAQGSSNPVLSLARVETITNDEWRGLTSAGSTWKFDAEAAEATDNSPTLTNPSVPTRRADGFIPFSIEINMDWPTFAANMSAMLGSGYDELLADKLVTGTGANTPVGVVQAVAAVTAARSVLATAGTIAPSDIYNIWGQLHERHRRKNSTAWLSSEGTHSKIRQFGTLDPNFTLTIGEGGTTPLFGKSYRVSDYVPSLDATTATTAANILVMGDFKGYLVAQRAGMQVEYIPNLMGSNNRPTGQRGWFGWARVGAGLVDPTALRILQNKTS